MRVISSILNSIHLIWFQIEFHHITNFYLQTFVLNFRKAISKLALPLINTSQGLISILQIYHITYF